ncbi:hypothetical protein [Sphingomonas quercus]|uniref:Uncharacterized protein n=1 Tax=Sphingomonas quercus TaxID=2842451 RepID=A0ABS6BJ99_9SPHN|nr:hypothetical protein [Sphingomonas quercus]MBU3078259.1 hypothetical protein [Sphingomonas quercus]
MAIGVAAGLSVSLRDATVPMFGSGPALAAVAISALALIRKWRAAR